MFAELCKKSSTSPIANVSEASDLISHVGVELFVFFILFDPKKKEGNSKPLKFHSVFFFFVVVVIHNRPSIHLGFSCVRLNYLRSMDTMSLCLSHSAHSL